MDVLSPSGAAALAKKIADLSEWDEERREVGLTQTSAVTQQNILDYL